MNKLSRKNIETKRKFKAGDKVQVLRTDFAKATAGLKVGDVAEVTKYLVNDIVMLKSPHQSECAYFDELSLELVEEKSKRKFKVGDKVRVLDTSFLAATTLLSVGEIAEVIGYKSDFEEYVYKKEKSVVVSDLNEKYEAGFFRESALELVERKTVNEPRVGVIEKAKEFIRACICRTH